MGTDADFSIYLGTRVWSSWSLRPWLVLRKTGARFDEFVMTLREAGTKAAIAAFSPSGMVPLLVDHRGREPVRVWDSLSICEYLAESFPERQLWPKGAAVRALARSVSAEMHSGFRPLRMAMPMDLFASRPGGGIGEEGVAADVERIDAIFRSCREAHGDGGPYLFGHFTIADAMFTPVASRFRTYSPPLSKLAADYVATLLGDPDFRAWEDAARREM